MKLWLTGVNHRTAPVEVRERLAFSETDVSSALARLRNHAGICEALILSTCNRVEVVVSANDEADPREVVTAFLCGERALDRSALERHLYEYNGADAVRHVFRVASSLDSMIVGEPQILGQLKGAYAIAKATGAINGMLDTVLTRAFSVAKRVRSETDIGASAVSVSYAAVELARDIFGSLKDRRVMLIGAGKMSELAARHLHRSGAAIHVANRTASRAEALAELVGGTVVPYDEYRSHLKEADIIITSSGASGYLLNKEDVKRVLGARKNRPMFIIDIAVPRNVDPAVNQLDNVFLYDIDDLQKVVKDNLKSRMDEASEADLIVAEEVERLEAWMRARAVGPVIAELQDQLERLRSAEVERMRGKLGPLSPQQEQAIEALTRGIIAKIAHGPISELRKQAANTESSAAIDAIRSMFRLGANGTEPARARGK